MLEDLLVIVVRGPLRIVCFVLRQLIEKAVSTSLQQKRSGLPIPYPSVSQIPQIRKICGPQSKERADRHVAAQHAQEE